ncbi:MAG: anthranilate phosphoribosyltransferase [Candidatus Poribacteria bacterium]|nr:anthranilate phosphoribosyltransferase [Candidatus Poribacteria bacterium]
MIQQAIQQLVDRIDLSEEDAHAAMNEIMSGEATPAQVAAFITALRMKGETVDEVTGLARVMRQHATRIDSWKEPLVDTCGTGGDGKHTFNISTAAAFVVAGAGGAVAKHGNRAASSKCGSADVLRELGVNVDAEPDTVERCIQNAGIGFLFAVKLHGAMKHAIGPRREIGVRTVFNLLGPLTNPAGAPHQLIGVFAAEWTEPLAHVLNNLGSERALVVHGGDGLDEITTTTTTQISELRDKKVRTYTFDPADYGIARATEDDLKGDDAPYNAGKLRGVLSGDDKGALRDITVVNAAGAIIAAGLEDEWGPAIARAKASIDSGTAQEALDNLILHSNR